MLVLSITSYITAQEHVIKYNKHEVNLWDNSSKEYIDTELGSDFVGGKVEVTSGYNGIKIYYKDLVFNFIDLTVNEKLSTDEMVVIDAKHRKTYEDTVIIITDHTTSFVAGDYLIQLYDLQ